MWNIRPTGCIKCAVLDVTKDDIKYVLSFVAVCVSLLVNRDVASFKNTVQILQKLRYLK